MTPAGLLTELRSRGVVVEPRGAKLRVRPISRLSPDEREALRRVKPEILQLLSPAPASPLRGPIAAYRLIAALWTLGAQGGSADRDEIRRLLDTQARLCDELGPEFAAAIGRRTSRAWAERERRCPFCGLADVYHDPDSGAEIASAEPATPVPVDSSGWPIALPGLGPRAVGPFAACSTCGAGTWAAFGVTPLCRPCAGARGGGPR